MRDVMIWMLLASSLTVMAMAARHGRVRLLLVPAPIPLRRIQGAAIRSR